MASIRLKKKVETVSAQDPERTFLWGSREQLRLETRVPTQRAGQSEPGGWHGVQSSRVDWSPPGCPRTGR